ncbi:CIS tube protein [Frankia sp. AgKG'84/4]|uniref:CIS tube protein n=1 Tax=Frankia sp. AgKG'84/4 TaxID=573490 RepID=UPI00200BA566|nr:peptidoglycan-binding protein [Frankia sp. AgKG'84/4]MCL9795933.1 peptidoglycan-binding protein [Frankia sp. AgKG'84/4]
MASTRPGPSLAKASLAIHEPSTSMSRTLGALIELIEFQFNPNTLRLAKSAEWNPTLSRTFKEGGEPEFAGGQPRHLSFQIFLDSSLTPNGTSVMKRVDTLLSCCEVTAASVASNHPCTPWVFFEWGGFSTVSFVAYVDSVSVNYSLFSPSGVPIRATCDLEITQIPARTARQNPTSGALTARRTHCLTAGDSLQSLAWREYGDPTAWRGIAELNGIDDPMRLPTGLDILLPAADEARR